MTPGIVWNQEQKQAFLKQIEEKIQDDRQKQAANRWSLQALRVTGAVLGFLATAIGLFAAAEKGIEWAWVTERRGLLMTVAAVCSAAAGLAPTLINQTEVSALLAEQTARIATLEELKAQVTLETVTPEAAGQAFGRITKTQPQPGS